MPADDGASAPGVLITGAAGGLGSALVNAFHSAGWRVVAGVRARALDDPKRLHGTVSLDLTDEESVSTGVRRARELCGGRLDAMVCNAGIARDGAVWQLSSEDWDDVMEVNLKGSWRCARHAAAVMAAQGGGHILLVSSFAGRQGTRGQSNYAASKAGLIGMGLAVARELGAANVRVNMVLPGLLKTPMTASMDPGALEHAVAQNALGRINDLSEVASFIAFLAGLRNVSGQLFQLDSRIPPWT